jgi:hypothetical protein
MTFQIAVLPLLMIGANSETTDVDHQYDRWERQLRARVEALHVVPAWVADGAPCDVTVGFSIDAKGRPAEPTIKQSSCQSFHERASLRLVRNLGGIGKIPSLSGNPQNVLLKLSYGSAPTQAADRQLSASLQSERRRWDERNLRIVTQPMRTAATE